MRRDKHLGDVFILLNTVPLLSCVCLCFYEKASRVRIVLLSLVFS